MLRCAALAILFSCVSSGIIPSAAGNIGCLFSETLCNQEKEWCNDDNAFGRCLSLYGNVRDGDMYRYNLGTEELHVLELEMQRLFLLGYRWSHTYTQCVLQALLRAIRNKSQFNISDCNEELDQDLEGALKAIEGEEMEHVDARDLAIVRFTPSELNPHSDYADELYYPPMDEMLMSPVGEKFKDVGEINSEEESSENKQKDSEILIPPLTPTAKEDLRGGKGHSGDVETVNNNNDRVSNSIKNHLSLPPPALHQPYYQDIEPYPIDEGDFAYDLGYDVPRAHPLNSIYKRNGYKSGDNSFGRLENYYRGPIKMNDLRSLANLLSKLGTTDHAFNGLNQPLYYGNDKLTEANSLSHQKIDSENKQDIFKDRPIMPTYRNTFPLLMNNKNSVYAPYDNEYKMRGSDSYYTSDLPELDLPKEDDSVPDAIHAGFVKEFEKENYQNDQSNNMRTQPELVKDDDYFKNVYDNKYGKYHYDPETVPYNDNSVSRFGMDSRHEFDSNNYENLPIDSNPYQWQHKSKNNEKNYKTLPESQPRHGDPMNTMSQGQLVPWKNLYYRRQPMISYYDNYDYVPDYYDQYVDYAEMQAGARPNFLRDERLDIKKEGPSLSNNAIGFDYSDIGDQGSPSYAEGNEDYLYRLDPDDDKSLLMAKLRENKDLNGDVKEVKAVKDDQYRDLVLSDKGYVKDTIGRGQNPHNSALRQVSNGLKDRKIKDKVLPDSYVYISISRNFTSYREAEQLVGIILHLVGLEPNNVKNFSMENNQVMFEIRKNNSLGMTAANLAEKTEELKDAINTKTEMDIIQSGVGTRSALTAVVYNAGKDRQMYTAVAVVCGVCSALLFAATVLFFIRSTARSRAKLQGFTPPDSELVKDIQDLCRARISSVKGEVKESSGPGHAHPVGTNWSGHAPRISSLSKESDNGNKSPSSRSSTSSWSEEPVISNMDISTGHMVLSYMEDHLRNKSRLEQEWVALCAYEAEPCSCNLALKPENAQKNRYPDVTPYDNNRVVLNEHTNVSGSSYVNASTITDHDPRNPAYISTQGPLAGTAADFWQLIWEQGGVVIVMLTRLTENGQALCHRYWPEEGSELYHIYEVHLVSEHIWCDDYLVRSFYLKNVKTGETRTVTQFHFLSWPESGIPASTKALLEFRRKVNKSYRGRSCPIVVHCSDGVGRAGTYCLIDMVLNRMAKGTKEIDIAATLEHIRDQRPNMVKTKAQFEFVLMTVAEEVHAILKALPQ